MRYFREDKRRNGAKYFENSTSVKPIGKSRRNSIQYNKIQFIWMTKQRSMYPNLRNIISPNKNFKNRKTQILTIAERVNKTFPNMKVHINLTENLHVP